MRQLYIEQYVPCGIEEIKDTIKTKPFSDFNIPLFLKSDIYAYRMNKGFLIECNRGQFLLDSLDVIKSINGMTIKELSDQKGDMEEIEQLHYYGLISYDNHYQGKVIYHEVEQKYLSLYNKMETTWFSYTPLKVEIDITNKCNCQCIHCAHNASPTAEQGKLSYNDYINLLRQASEIGVSEILFMGGEPTCSPYFLEFASMAKSLGIRHLSTSTNCWQIDDILADKMSKLFDSVQISIHGANKKTHDYIVGRPGAFERACEAARMLKQLNISHVNISFTVMKRNVNEIQDMMELALTMGISDIRFLVLSPHGRGHLLDQWTDEEKRSLSATIRRLRKQYSGCINLKAGGFPPFCKISDDASLYGCPAARFLLYVNADGIIKPCTQTEIVVGSTQKSSLIEAWHNNMMINFRRILPCNCKYKVVCAGGCLGVDKWLQVFQKQNQGGSDGNKSSD